MEPIITNALSLRRDSYGGYEPSGPCTVYAADNALLAHLRFNDARNELFLGPNWISDLAARYEKSN